MKILVLMRHAKAEKDFTNKADTDRELTDRGEDDAKEMGKRLYKSGFKPQLIVCSPARRTLKTARIAGTELHCKEADILSEDLLYEAVTDDLMKVIRHLDDKYSKVMIVGHNPLFTSAAGYFTRTFVEHLPTSGYVEIVFPFESWKMVSQHTGELKKMDYPKNDEA